MGDTDEGTVDGCEDVGTLEGLADSGRFVGRVEGTVDGLLIGE